MRRCPKCSGKYDDSMRICRTCGSFLEVAFEDSVEEGSNSETPPVMQETPPVFAPTKEEQGENLETAPDIDVPRPFSGKRSWRCPQCQKPVPTTFDACWNCGTNRDGIPDPEFVKEPLDITRDEAEEEPATRKTVRRRGLTCPKCGSSKIIPKARILDKGQHSDGDLNVVVYGNPEAMIFKDRLYGKLTADVCGECGYVEIRVENPEELYDHYRHASK